MTNALAIASVTAVLKDLLDDALVNNSVSAAMSGSVRVSALAPDRIDDDATQLNIFLYHAAPNAGWRNTGLPSRNRSGGRMTNPPLALDLYYLLTAYGKENFEAEILLGYAMQIIHEMPVLTRELIREVLAAPSGGGGIVPPALAALAASDLAEQVEQIKVTPQSLTIEELSKLWAALQANYRPSVAYHVSVVLIESTFASRAPLPVLMRGTGDRGVITQPDLTPPFPTLTSVAPPDKQLAARLGEVLTLSGFQLDGESVTVRAANARLPASFALTPLADNTATSVTVRLEDDAATDPQNWIAGFYTLTVEVTSGGETRTTNEVAFALAPRITSTSAARDADGNVVVTVECVPDVRAAQRASLIVGDHELQAEAHPDQTNQLIFIDRTETPAGTYFVRLRVDGVESVLINRTTTPPTFEASQQVTVPPPA
ncbi:MAG: DUF4255 domain-containing protein [Acidobacteriota bacterium]|nr:DUF4255 domain-containing protein [Acidobacteriota bacterium]